MSNYLDFESWQKGYKPLEKSRQSLKDNIGKRICYLHQRDYDSYRGYMNVRYGNIEDVKRNTVYLDNGEQFDYKDVLEMGIKIEEDE